MNNKCYCCLIIIGMFYFAVFLASFDNRMGNPAGTINLSYGRGIDYNNGKGYAISIDNLVIFDVTKDLPNEKRWKIGGENLTDIIIRQNIAFISGIKLYIINISNPNSVYYIKNYSTGQVLDIDIGNTCLYAIKQNIGISIININDLQNPIEDYLISLPSAVSLDCLNNILYITNTTRLFAYEVSIPSSPVLLDSLDINCSRVYAYKDVIYCINLQGIHVVKFDIGSNLNYMRLIQAPNALLLSIQGERALLSKVGGISPQFYIYDLKNPLYPKEIALSEGTFGTNDVRDILLLDNYFLMTEHSTIQLFQMLDLLYDRFIPLVIFLIVVFIGVALNSENIAAFIQKQRTLKLQKSSKSSYNNDSVYRSDPNQNTTSEQIINQNRSKFYIEYDIIKEKLTTTDSITDLQHLKEDFKNFSREYLTEFELYKEYLSLKRAIDEKIEKVRLDQSIKEKYNIALNNLGFENVTYSPLIDRIINYNSHSPDGIIKFINEIHSEVKSSIDQKHNLNAEIILFCERLLYLKSIQIYEMKSNSGEFDDIIQMLKEKVFQIEQVVCSLDLEIFYSEYNSICNEIEILKNANKISECKIKVSEAINLIRKHVRLLEKINQATVLTELNRLLRILTKQSLYYDYVLLITKFADQYNEIIQLYQDKQFAESLIRLNALKKNIYTCENEVNSQFSNEGNIVVDVEMLTKEILKWKHATDELFINIKKTYKDFIENKINEIMIPSIDLPKLILPDIVSIKPLDDIPNYVSILDSLFEKWSEKKGNDLQNKIT